MRAKVRDEMEKRERLNSKESFCLCFPVCMHILSLPDFRMVMTRCRPLTLGLVPSTLISESLRKGQRLSGPHRSPGWLECARLCTVTMRGVQFTPWILFPHLCLLLIYLRTHAALDGRLCVCACACMSVRVLDLGWEQCDHKNHTVKSAFFESGMQ